MTHRKCCGRILFLIFVVIPRGMTILCELNISLDRLLLLFDGLPKLLKCLGSALAKGREMTAAMLEEYPELDFLYYSNDMIGAGGLLYLLEKGVDIPGQIGLAGFNGVNLLKGLPKELATMDACRLEIGKQAAQVIVDRVGGKTEPQRIVLEPTISYGQTLKRRW